MTIKVEDGVRVVKIKRVVVLLLITLLLFPTNVFDIGKANASSISDFEYEVINNNEIKIVKYIGDSKEVIIPKTIEGKAVTVLGLSSFFDKGLTSVNIPEGVEEIHGSAFGSNPFTTPPIIPTSVKIIMYGAFVFSGNEFIVKSRDVVIDPITFHFGTLDYRSPSDIILHGYEGTSVEEHARSEGFTFKTIEKDTTPPSVSVSKNGGSWSQSHSTRINASDSGSGLNTVQYRWTTNTTFPTSGWTTGANGTTVNAPTSTGNHYLHVRATDNVGNVQQFTSNVFRVDRTVPTTPTISAPTGWQTANQSFTVTAGTDSHSGVARTEYRINSGSWTTYNSAVSVTTNGTTTIQARTIDNAGNISGTRSTTIQIDKTNPSLTLTQNPTGHTNGNVTITATGSDSHSGVKRIRQGTGSWVNTSSMTHTVTANGAYSFTVEDNAGRTTTQSITVNNIDKTLPTVSLSNNGGDWSQSHSTRINASDSGSGVDKVEYRWTTGTSFPTSGFTTVSNGATVSTPNASGNHYLHVRATDNAGNVRQFTSSVFRVDNTVPTVPTISGGTEWQKDNQTITISQGDDGHSGVDKTQYRLDGGSWQTYNGAFTILKEGSTKVEARTLDKAGNVSSIATKTIKVDKTSPTLSITPSTTSITHSDVVLTVKGTDTHSGVKRIKLPNNTWVNDTTASYTVKENGEYTFVVEDNAGNITTQTYEVTNIDKTISFDSPNIDDFGRVVLGGVDAVSTDVSPVIVRDWREGNNEWKVNVQATKLTNGKHTLPNGMLMLNGLSDIKRVEGAGSLPTKGFTGKKAIDEGQVNLVTSESARGEYKLAFPHDALEIKVDPSIMKKGTYESTISWELINAP